MLPLGEGSNPSEWGPTSNQPWLDACDATVIQTITASLGGGLIKPREFITVCRCSVTRTDGGQVEVWRQDSIGLTSKEWPVSTDSKGRKRTRGNNHQVCFIATPVKDAPEDQPTCTITYLLQSSSGGWVPNTAVDLAIVDEHMLPMLRGMCRVLNLEDATK
jgi:hypothetical protein